MNRVYIESTVISYFTARPSSLIEVRAHQLITKRWWKKAIIKLVPCVSAFVLTEISKGDPAAAQKRLASVKTFTILGANSVTDNLAKTYFKKLNLPSKAWYDALHLACATLNGVEYLVTWNFTHLANAHLRHMVEDINASRDLETPVICTPEELVEV
ncbi:MAG: hypothetical protein A2268_10890 [Candidatus Raymondbacteria bacterium RifOxyA12_full_50_37]|uniref:PIN domain-containing protein n=1 Tax=Candidatus Raymondbacteria bacterium RIFOXYD12_FULL_49_13 TaxID=1817890 RepID=A0A1F7F1Z8_UNCRA|nr:MAG: hypothetical protein A2268_10890 [Candidatus Raymondbacteria bacterium RifOxyA12_full_50_37]OGJ85517.1 MAG: hypothetical protein A2248_12675 [Candidatus Raymondbacteria bacterium RIFOXYA2_FULL_49_16]OGJ95020.1 MAG: hypothetical protein A2453_07375 [Candidatus Raymondbacteria bacterium RIFOXYC2_FULL_50_21]OGK00684.1 MAG: hypothetical protein A2519_20010 [Candidatus Raymondbacteria bacterium RIFOXYD12_FULL_49_13]OGK01289.1 MAG: hypothetical protein A2350_08365 [Candidatus Raymondbacteria 